MRFRSFSINIATIVVNNHDIMTAIFRHTAHIADLHLPVELLDLALQLSSLGKPWCFLPWFLYML